MAVALEDRKSGVENTELVSIGWLLHHLGKQMSDYQNHVAMAYDILNNCEPQA